MRVCHPEPVSFAGEGSAVREKAKEKADSSPVQKPNGVRNDRFSSFALGGRSFSSDVKCFLNGLSAPEESFLLLHFSASC
jgi:hypothetical protein